MTREELKRQVNDGGKDFIDAFSDGKYRNNWFDTNALYDNPFIEKVLRAIKDYNEAMYIWQEYGLEEGHIKEYTHSYFSTLEGILDILNVIHYFNINKYGSLDSFIDYCFYCWYNRCQILLAEYDMIKIFFED